MEQWNKEEYEVVNDFAEEVYQNLGWGEKGQLYSLNGYLLKHYLESLLRKHNIEKSELKETDIYKQIQEISLKKEGVERNVDVEIKNLKNRLFLILDSLLGKDNHKLLANENGHYKFNNTNIVFLDFLFETFDDENSKRIRKKMLLEVDEEYLQCIYFGLKELAQNENTLLDESKIEKIWSVDYCMAYRGMIDARESLSNMVDYYSDFPRDLESNIDFFHRAEKLLSSCEEFLCRLGDSMLQLPPDNIFNDIIEKERG